MSYDNISISYEYDDKYMIISIENEFKENLTLNIPSNINIQLAYDNCNLFKTYDKTYDVKIDKITNCEKYYFSDSYDIYDKVIENLTNGRKKNSTIIDKNKMIELIINFYKCSCNN